MEGAVGSPSLRFAEAPAVFPVTVDFISNIRDMSADKQSQSDLGFVSLVGAAQRLVAQSKQGRLTRVFEDPALRLSTLSPLQCLTLRPCCDCRSTRHHTLVPGRESGRRGQSVGTGGLPQRPHGGGFCCVSLSTLTALVIVKWGEFPY